MTPHETLYTQAPDGYTYVCMACGKISPTRAPTRQSSHGWDESCMLNCQLAAVNQLTWSDDKSRVVHVHVL